MEGGIRNIMKNIIIGICACVLTGILLLTVYTLHGRQIRKTGLNQALDAGLKQTVDQTGTRHTDGPKSNEEMIALFLEKFMMQIESDSRVEVEVLDADYEKGLLSAEATLYYKHPNGKEGSVSACKTVIRFRTEEPAEYCDVEYVVNGNSYKSYHVQKGTTLMIPGAPVSSGKVFKGWRELDGADVISLVGQIVERDCIFVAVFQ